MLVRALANFKQELLLFSFFGICSLARAFLRVLPIFPGGSHDVRLP